MTVPDPGEELVEEVDAAGAVVGVVSRKEMRTTNLRHRNVAVIVQRTSGRIVVHQRAAWKDVHPLLWDIAFGGVPGVGETDHEAAIRELGEEAGIIVGEDELVDLGSGSHDDDHTRWVGRFFAVRTDETLTPSDGEVIQMSEVQPAELTDWTTDHPLCPDVHPLLLLVSGSFD